MSMQEKPQDIEAWLNALGAPSADRDYKPGHARIQKLIQRLKFKGFEFSKPKFRVRIAGTNGKGSTANFLAAALQVNGLRVGLYTSPHILTFHERIRVNGEPIADAELLSLMAEVMPLALEVGTSYFETATVLALLCFSQQKVDVEILEAGVGAKLDATTAVAADMALLTPIALDHQSWLGNTRSEIASEKAFVFQGCSIQISAPQVAEVAEVLDAVSSAIEAPLFEGELHMLGQHQRINAGLAYAGVMAMAKYLNQIDAHLAKEAMAKLEIEGRLQTHTFKKHTFVLDAAHNEHAVLALLPALAKMDAFDVIFVATREDRNLSEVLDKLEPYASRLVARTGEMSDFVHIRQVLDDEISQYEAGRFLVLGSFITIAETLNWLKKQNI